MNDLNRRDFLKITAASMALPIITADGKIELQDQPLTKIGGYDVYFLRLPFPVAAVKYKMKETVQIHPNLMDDCYLIQMYYKFPQSKRILHPPIIYSSPMTSEMIYDLKSRLIRKEVRYPEWGDEQVILQEIRSMQRMSPEEGIFVVCSCPNSRALMGVHQFRKEHLVPGFGTWDLIKDEQLLLDEKMNAFKKSIREERKQLGVDQSLFWKETVDGLEDNFNRRQGN